MYGLRLRHRDSFFRRYGRSIAGAGLSLLCLLAAALVSPSAPARAGLERQPAGARLSGETVARLPTGIRRLLADTSWVLAVQHYGERRLQGVSGFPSLGPLIATALGLDPELRPAAVVGAQLLAEAPPFGAGQVRRADRLLADWTARHPRDFEAVLARGLLHHTHLRNPQKAAGILGAAADRETTPAWFSALAARALTEVGARQSARALWRALLRRAGDDRTRANARMHLLQLDALDQRDRLVLVTRAFERARQRPPRNWDELIAAGFLKEKPSDPAGALFELGGDGVARIARDSPLAGYPGR